MQMLSDSLSNSFDFLLYYLHRFVSEKNVKSLFPLPLDIFRTMINAMRHASVIVFLLMVLFAFTCCTSMSSFL